MERKVYYLNKGSNNNVRHPCLHLFHKEVFFYFIFGCFCGGAVDLCLGELRYGACAVFSSIMEPSEGGEKERRRWERKGRS